MRNLNAKKSKRKNRKKKVKDILDVRINSNLIGGEKTMRLSLVARKLDSGLKTIVDILKKYGENIEPKPNAKISEAHFSYLKEYLFKEKYSKPYVKDYTYQLIEDLKLDYQQIFHISPEAFENLVMELLKRNKFHVTKIGDTNQKDGGIDIVAIKKDIVNIIIAVQVKHKQSKKVEVGEVRDFAGALSINNFFSAGMLVTNTDFTQPSKWIEEKLESKVELKNSNDIQNWLLNNFTTAKKSDIDVEIGKGVRFTKEI